MFFLVLLEQKDKYQHVNVFFFLFVTNSTDQFIIFFTLIELLVF